MEKRYFIIFLLLTLSLIPSASAIIELGNTTPGKYNLGDTVNLDGKLLSTTDMSYLIPQFTLFSSMNVLATHY